MMIIGSVMAGTGLASASPVTHAKSVPVERTLPKVNAPEMIKVRGNPDIPATAGASICWDNSGTYGCNWEDGTSGDEIENRPYYEGGGAQVYTLHSAECAQVGNGCNPFPTGSGLNSDLTGGYIYTMENDAHSDCIDMPFSTGLPTEGSCSGSNAEVWVWYPQGGGFWSIVNVSYSSQAYDNTGDKNAAYDLEGCNDNGSFCYPNSNPSLGDCGTYCEFAEYQA
jgi:hypothetical protein